MEMSTEIVLKREGRHGQCGKPVVLGIARYQALAFNMGMRMEVAGTPCECRIRLLGAIFSPPLLIFGAPIKTRAQVSKTT